ncbi:MAG: glycoside hydrolase family 3 N-terminal domain-containing protein [Pseudomonadota bacterium]
MPSAAIKDCEGPLPTADEVAFFKEADPLGFILFADHCETPDAARAHTDALKEALGRDDLLFLIDQEGGRVARMKPPAFPSHPPAARFGELWRLDPKRAMRAAHLNAQLLGRMVRTAGINVNCVPMLDIPQIDTDPTVIGDRALAGHPDIVGELGRAVHDGTIAGGALPVVKHLPGHGRSLCDSHEALPRVDDRLEDLEATDFPPFIALKSALMGMTAHIIYKALDPDMPATLSKTVINETIRARIGFEGLLFSDDLRMGALAETGLQTLGARAEASLKAGCDVALCCNFTMAEKVEAAERIGALEGTSKARSDEVIAALSDLTDPAVEMPEDTDALYQELQTMLKPVLIS